MGATLQDTLAEYATLAKQQNTIQPPPAKPGAPPPVTQGPPQGQPAPLPPAKSPGILDRVVNAAKATFAGPADLNPLSKGNLGTDASVGAGLLRAPGQLIGGALDTVRDAGHFIDDNIHAPFARAALSPVVGAAKALDQSSAIHGGASLADVLSNRQQLGQVGNPQVNQTVAEFAGAGAPMLIPGVGELPLAARAALMGATSAAAINTTQGDNPGQALAERAKNAAVGAAMETGFGLLHSYFHAKVAGNTVTPATPTEVAADGLNRDFATQRTQDARYAAVDPRGAEPVEQEVVPPGRHSDDTGAAGPQSGGKGAEAGTVDPVVTDANAALEKSGAAQRLDPAEPTPVGPDGKIAVDPTTKATLDQAGMGRSFTVKQPPIVQFRKDFSDITAGMEPPAEGTTRLWRGERPGEQGQGLNYTTDAPGIALPFRKMYGGDLSHIDVPTEDLPKYAMGGGGATDAEYHLPPEMAASSKAIPAANVPGDVTYMKETSPDGGSRVVGSMDQKGLNGFLEDAKKFSDNPETINTQAEHPSGQWNLRPLGSADDVSAMGRAFADRLPERGPVTDAEMMAAAKEMGFDSPADAHLLASQFSSSTEGLGKGVVASRMMAAKINEEMAGLRGVDWTTVPDGDPKLEAALASYHNGYSFMQSFRQGKSEIARSLRLMGQDLETSPLAKGLGVKPADDIPPTPVPDFDTYKNNFGKTPDEELQPVPPGERPPLPRNKSELNDAVNEHELADSFGPDAVNAFWKGRTFHPDALKYLRTSVANFYTAALVSNPATFMRDLFGPGVMATMETMERAGGAVGQGISKLASGDIPGANQAFMSAVDAPRAFASTFSDIQSSIQMALKTFKSGNSVLGGPGPYLSSLHSNIPQSLIDAASNTSADKAMFSVGNLINTLPDFIHRLHGGVNELALRLSYLGHMRASAYDYGRSLGLEGDGLNSYVKEAVMSAEDPLTGQATNGTALEQAQRTTFTRPVVTDPANQPVMATLDSTIRTIRENVPETRLILPIYNIPANAFGETLRRIPALGMMFKETQADLRGLNGNLAQASAYGRQMMGAGALTAGALMARAGILTGAGPDNPHDRQVWTQAGYQPYSIKGPDGKYHSYARVDGLGPLLGMMASLTDASVHHDPESVQQRAVGLVSGLAEYMKDQSSLKGLSDLLSFGGHPSEDGRGFERMMEGWSSGFVPRFMQMPRNALDPDKRVVTNPVEAIENATPILSKNLDPVRNLYGDINHVSQNDLGILPVTTSGVNPQGPDQDEMKEHQRLMLASGYAPGLLPTSLNGAGVDQRQVKLEDGHSMYDARMRYRGLVTNDDGDTIHDAVRKVMSSEDYQQGYDGHNPRELQDDDGRYNRAALVAKTFDEFDKAAKSKLINDSPKAANYFAIADAKSKGLPGTEAHTTQDLVGNPGLTKALGIDVDAYKEKFAQ